MGSNPQPPPPYGYGTVNGEAQPEILAPEHPGYAPAPLLTEMAAAALAFCAADGING